ncbi:MAG: hypothetical protein QNL64_05525 [Porticoccus sp.]|jgi:hypothetical protein|tara:strand:+ start:7522 stop:7647 length:126 start_codon:yes stop_codon:yes gene_type:complete
MPEEVVTNQIDKKDDSVVDAVAAVAVAFIIIVGFVFWLSNQ